MFVRHFLMEGEGGGEGGGGSGGGGGQGGGGQGGGGEGQPGAVTREEFNALVEGMSLIAQGMKDQKTFFEQSLSGLKQPQRGKQGGDGGEDDDDDQGLGGGDVDLEGMSRADFAKYLSGGLLKQVEKMITSKVLPHVSQLSERLDSRSAAEDLEGLIEKGHKDVFEWKPEIQDFLKRNSQATISEAYFAVRGKNPDKAKKMEEKYAPKKSGNGGTDRQVISFFPTSRKGGGNSGTMTAKDAANAAFDEVMQKYGGAALPE